jgi:hypothetical protein
VISLPFFEDLVGRGEGGLGLEDGLAELYFAADGFVEHPAEGALH